MIVGGIDFTTKLVEGVGAVEQLGWYRLQISREGEVYIPFMGRKFTFLQKDGVEGIVAGYTEKQLLGKVAAKELQGYSLVVPRLQGDRVPMELTKLTNTDLIRGLSSKGIVFTELLNSLELVLEVGFDRFVVAFSTLPKLESFLSSIEGLEEVVKPLEIEDYNCG